MSTLHRDDELIVQYFGPQAQPPGELLPWVDLFKAWRDRLHHYHAVSRGDIAWEHPERPQVGFLAAAAWHIGGAAIEEYLIEKKGRNDRRSRSPGRADLWLSVNGREFVLEAKYATAQLDTRGTRRTLINTFDKAGMDSLRNTEDVHYTGGVSFVPLYLPANTSKASRTHYLNKHIDDIEDTEDDSLRDQTRAMFGYVFRVDLLGRHTRVGDALEPVGITMLVGLDK